MYEGRDSTLNTQWRRIAPYLIGYTPLLASGQSHRTVYFAMRTGAAVIEAVFKLYCSITATAIMNAVTELLYVPGRGKGVLLAP